MEIGTVKVNYIEEHQKQKKLIPFTRWQPNRLL